jgi:hypothetical protein
MNGIARWRDVNRAITAPTPVSTKAAALPSVLM